MIHQRAGWVVEHCVGPLPLGTLIVKPERHVVHVADLRVEEADALGPLLRETADVVTRLCTPEQVYVCLWSHGPVHIHFVVQPATRALMDRTGLHGPKLQVALFDAGDVPGAPDVEAFADRARAMFGTVERGG